MPAAPRPRKPHRPASRKFRPSNLIQVFGFADDYSFGVLQSHAHWLWFITKCGKLKSDFRYSAESVFDTFPWPQFIDAAPPVGAPEARIPGRVGVPPAGSGILPERTSAMETDRTNVPKVRFGGTPKPAGGTPTLPGTDLAKIEAVAAAGREIRRIRAQAMPKMKGGLRALYRTLELPGANPLKAAHAALLAAYGFSPKADLLAQLFTLNREVAARLATSAPVTAPGIPENCQKLAGLITGDCIKPSS